jgi:hypothetical protein
MVRKLYIFLIIFRPLLLRMRDVSVKSCTENQNTHFVFSNFCFRKSCHLWDMWKNTVEPGRPHMTIWRMRIACYVPGATSIRSEYVIIIAFPPQQWLHELASMLCCITLPVLYVYIKYWGLFTTWVLPASQKSLSSRQ